GIDIPPRPNFKIIEAQTPRGNN
ncbi:unnamed protein product, partial [Rotaria sp. Silwood1]